MKAHHKAFTAVAAALVAVGAAVAITVAVMSDSPRSSTAEPSRAQTSSGPVIDPSVAADPDTITAKVGEAFDIDPWQITVTSIKCGTAAEVLAQNASNGQEPGDRVCVAKISYKNTDKLPHLFGKSDEDPMVSTPEGSYAGYAADGSVYEGHTWAAERVNPGLSQTNELIFAVPAGLELTAVQIGYVRVTA